MNETVEVNKFLKTGNFGEFREIHFGMTRGEMLGVLGETEWKHFSFKKSKFPSIYKYGKVEFYFDEEENGKLYGIQILPSIQESDLVNLKVNYDILDSVVGYELTLKYLKRNSINYTIINSEFDNEDVVRVETDGGVQIIFSKNFDEPLSIEKISKFIPDPQKQERVKQINFSILESEYKKLKELAEKERISISKVCKKLILERLKRP